MQSLIEVVTAGTKLSAALEAACGGVKVCGRAFLEQLGASQLTRMCVVQGNRWRLIKIVSPQPHTA